MHFKIFPWGISVKFAMLLIFGKYANVTRLNEYSSKNNPC